MKTIFYRDTEGCDQDQVNVFIWKDPKERISFILPEGFREMEEEKKEENYPMSERPEVILEDELGRIQVTLQFLDKAMSREETNEAARQVYELAQSSFAQCRISSVYLYEKGEIPVGWFLMSIKTLKCEHIKAVFSIDNHMALLTLTYPEEERMKWHVFIKHLFDSVHLEKGASHGTGDK